MSKIYGYKEEDVVELAKYVRLQKGKSLSDIFAEYGQYHNKAKGTVRNLYYALAKQSNLDKEFCDKYLEGKPLSVSRIESFSLAEEKELIKKILLGQREGKSARGVIMEIANGDGRLALRYQNKFRNAIKNKSKLVAEIIKEIKDEGQDVNEFSIKSEVQNIVSEKQMQRLKSEINNLVAKISLKTQKENERLKERIRVLEKENIRLSSQLYSNSKHATMRFFKARNSEDMLN